MQTIFAGQALIGEQWFTNVRLDIKDGRISKISENVGPSQADMRVDTLLPALSNVHSHGFQRAMAGMTEYRVADHESFWTWRELMYRFLNHLTADHVEAITAQAYVEMLESGFAAVGEFHYLHHQLGGAHYDRIAELSERVMAAASNTGIGLTHLPVLYRFGGAGEMPLAGGQMRFGNSIDRFSDLLDACRNSVKHLPSDARVGVAPHSLRAIAPSDLKHVVTLAAGSPIHLHIAEQVKEVEDISKWLGKRPVAWLVENAPVNRQWCAIHATHMTVQETNALADTGAVAGLCPITEANLGDGAFNGPQWLEAHGKYGVGTDSNIHISMVEELRTLEYSQRLRDQQRNVLAGGQGSTGAKLYMSAAHGGAQALGRKAGAIAVDHLADLVAIDSKHVSLVGLTQSQLLDGLCFAAPANVVREVWSAGRHVVQDGCHISRDRIAQNYRKALIELRAML